MNPFKVGDRVVLTHPINPRDPIVGEYSIHTIISVEFSGVCLEKGNAFWHWSRFKLIPKELSNITDIKTYLNLLEI